MLISLPTQEKVTVLRAEAPMTLLSCAMIDSLGWAQLESTCGKTSSPHSPLAVPAVGPGFCQSSTVYRAMSRARSVMLQSSRALTWFQSIGTFTESTQLGHPEALALG